MHSKSLEKRAVPMVTYGIQAVRKDLIFGQLTTDIASTARTYRNQLCFEEWIVNVIWGQEGECESNEDILVSVV